MRQTIPILWITLLAACASHENGCEGSDAEHYAQVVEPEASCTTIKYGDGKRTPDYAFCKVGTENWFCQSVPDICWQIIPVKVGRLPQ